MREPAPYTNGVTAATRCTTPSNPQSAGLSAGDALIDAVAEAVEMKLHRMGLACHQRLMDVHDTARYLGMTANAVREKASARELPCIRVDGRLRLDRLELDRWIERALR